jgi:hypothetical protein
MLVDGCLLVLVLADGHGCLRALAVRERYVLMLDDGGALVGRWVLILIGR